MSIYVLLRRSLNNSQASTYFFYFQNEMQIYIRQKKTVYCYLFTWRTVSRAVRLKTKTKKNNRSFESSNVIVRNKNQSIESTNQSTEFFWVILFLYDMNVQKKKTHNNSNEMPFIFLPYGVHVICATWYVRFTFNQSDEQKCWC